MKKILTSILCGALLVSSLALTASAVDAGKNWGDVATTKDKIALDGKIDAAYTKSYYQTVDVIRESGKPATASAKVYYLWDADYLYVAADIKDAEIITPDPAKKDSAWTQDGIELCFDFANDGKTLSKWTTWCDGTLMNKSSNAITDAEYKTSMGTDGYVVELRIKAPSAFKAGQKIGVNIILDNNTKAAGRVLVRAPQSLNATENEQAKYDYITLIDKVVTGVEPKASATTADPAILAVVSLAAATGAAFISKKRK